MSKHDEKEDTKGVGSTAATQGYKDATPGQSELPPEALDYEKYNVNNPIVPDEELDDMLDKGSVFKQSKRINNGRL